MIDSEANNYFIRTVVTEAGKEDGMSIFSIYILISVVRILQKKITNRRDGVFLVTRKQMFKLWR